MRTRALLAPAQAALADFPAVLLIGGRQVGKSTLAAQLQAAGALAASVTLDDVGVLAAATSDAQAFVTGLAHGTAIDEVQRAPEILRACKRVIDKDRRPGRFLLTGSANILALPTTNESLAGRAAQLELEGFALAEVHDREPAVELLEILFGQHAWPLALEQLRALTTPLPTADLRRAIFFGGFPEVALRGSVDYHATWFRSFLAMYVERDVRNLARIPDAGAFGTLFRLIASASGQLANLAQLGNDAKLDQRTAARYAGLLELTFQAKRLQPWFRNVRKRLVKTPKFYLCDPGFACFMLGVVDPGQLDHHPAIGTLTETWVFAELRKLISLGAATSIGFCRAHAGAEVDFVLERGDKLAAVEVKVGHKVTADDFRGIHQLREMAGTDLRGIVLHGGSEVIAFGDGLAAVPFGVLAGRKRTTVRARKGAPRG